MSQDLRTLLAHTASTYLDEKQGSSKGAKVRQIVEKDIVDVIKNNLNLDNNQYKIQGSIGQGNFAEIPWIAIFDRDITETAQEGVYLVYLFSSDMKKLYLSLNQGVTFFEKKYGSSKKTLEKIKAKSLFYKESFKNTAIDDYVLEIDLNSNEFKPREYMKGHIIGKSYDTTELPNNNVLINDIKHMINKYKTLIDTIEDEKELLDLATFNTDDEGFPEGKKVSKQHTSRERNQELIKKAKKNFRKLKGSLFCEVCNFCFKDEYGVIGEDFIEGHHIKPVSSMEDGEKTKVTDIVMLCSNCHRMIHRRRPWLTKENLKELLELENIK